MKGGTFLSSLSVNLSKNRYIWAGLLFAVGNWFAESALHVFVFHEGPFNEQVFTTDPHEIWMRLLAGVMFVFFGISTQGAFNIRQRNERALATSERKYRTLIEEALNPVFLLGTSGQFLDVNLAALEFFELDREELLSERYQDLSTFLGETASYEAPYKPNLGQSEVDFCINGGTKTLLLNVVPLPMPDDESQYFYGIGQDITERKQMDDNLNLAHQELNQIFQTASTGMRLINKDFNVLKVNETFVELSGVPREASVGAKCYEIFSGDRCHTEQCPMKRILEEPQDIEYEIRDQTKIDGADFACLLTARPFSDSDGETIGIVESFKDITELSRTQEELRTERDKLRQILFQQFEGVSILRADHTIEYQNATLTKELGDCTGMPCFKAFKGVTKPCSPCYMHRAIETGELQRCEFEVAGGRTFEHTYTPFSDTDSEDKVVVYLRDITEVKASRAAVIRSEQLAGVGELAAGVAHEINNPINGIINYAQMLVNQHGIPSAAHDLGSRIVGEGNRVARIVASLLSFARRGSEIKVPTSIEEILSESLTLVGTQIRKDSITLEVEVPKDLPPVLCVPQEIQQVFMNILNNARYALNKRSPGAEGDKRLEIHASTFGANGDYMVQISFRDTGDGIPPEIVDKIVNPFFSTKPKGEGTGLGLSISQNIVRSHGGDLKIESMPGQFTTVSIDLPVVVA